MKKGNIYSLIILIVVFFMILFIMVNSIKTNIQLNKLSNMFKDIEVLEDKISMYYLNYGTIPIKSKIEGFTNSLNPNDDSNYYEIDLEKLENINLYYKKKNEGLKDIYIINELSHTIYYYKGIEYNNYTFFSKELDYMNIEIENYR